MTIEKFPQTEPKKEGLVEQKLRKFFSERFNEDSNPDKRFDNILNALQLFFKVDDKNEISEAEILEMKDNVKRVCYLEDEQQFIASGLAALQPLLDWKNNNPKTFEARLRENQVAYLKYNVLNEMMTYDVHRKKINLHISPSETLSISEKISLVKDGLRRLAEVLKENEQIESVVATSWIVAANPGILEKLGFFVDGEISAEARANWRSVDDRPIASAHISRDDFLKRYC